MPIAKKRYPQSPRKNQAAHARGPYSDWKLDDLICANAAREIPLPLTDLPRYAGHAYSSVTVRATVCKRTNRLTRDGTLDPTHPANATIVPLPDLPPGWALPTPTPGQTSFATDRALAAVRDTTGTSLPAKLTYDDLTKILDQYIIHGGSGRDILTAIKTRLDMTDLSHGAGPPLPTTDAALSSRVVALLREVPPQLAASAILEYQAQPLPPALIPSNPEPPCAAPSTSPSSVSASKSSGATPPMTPTSTDPQSTSTPTSPSSRTSATSSEQPEQPSSSPAAGSQSPEQPAGTTPSPAPSS